jgi:hypothetical protein
MELSTTSINITVTSLSDGKTKFSIEGPDDPLVIIDILNFAIKQALGKAITDRDSNKTKIQLADPSMLKGLSLVGEN